MIWEEPRVYLAPIHPEWVGPKYCEYCTDEEGWDTGRPNRATSTVLFTSNLGHQTAI